MQGHAEGERCAAEGPLADLHPVEIGVALEALDTEARDAIARLIDAQPDGVTALRDAIAETARHLEGQAAHDLATRIVTPLIPEFLAYLDEPEGGPEAPVADELERAVTASLHQWPPLLVRLLLTLTWESARSLTRPGPPSPADR